MKRQVISLLVIMLTAAGLSSSRSARAEAPTYEIKKATTQAKVGVPSKASLTVQGKNGWHVNDQAPITVTVKGDPGVELPKPKLVRADLAQSSKESARFDIPFSASAAGKKTITAETRFVMCQEQACKPAKETVALEIDVAGAGEPAGAGKAKKAAAKAAP